MKSEMFLVVFTSKLTSDPVGYAEMSAQMEDEVNKMPGFLKLVSARDEIGITLSYWSSLEYIKQWKAHPKHLLAQSKGKTEWYDWYEVDIAKVIHSYSKM